MRLAKGSPCTIGELTKNLGVSRQGARKQLQVLLAANMVHLTSVGRETQVTLDMANLQVARTFIADLERQWDHRLGALKDFLENEND